VKAEDGEEARKKVLTKESGTCQKDYEEIVQLPAYPSGPQVILFEREREIDLGLYVRSPEEEEEVVSVLNGFENWEFRGYKMVA